MSVVMHAVSASYDGVKALDGIDATFESGLVTALVGGDGAGKSTLLKILAGRLACDSGSIDGLPSKAHIGYQPADGGVWDNLSVIDNMRFVARVYGLDSACARERIPQLVERAGLSAVLGRAAGNLSGGMRRKLGFIMAAVHSPDLLLLDEPTTGVDPSSREELWSLIGTEAMRGSTVVISTTYVDESERAGGLYLLNRGRVLAHGRAATISSGIPGRLYQAPFRQVSVLPEGDGLHNWRRADTAFVWSSGIGSDDAAPQGFTRCDADMENASIILLLRDEDAHGGSAVAEMPGSARRQPPQVPLPPQTPSTHAVAKVVEVDHVVKRFGKFTALDGVSLDVRPGEIVGLIGGNGAGKTTLMRILLGLEMATKGSVKLFGGAPGHDARRRVGYVPQGLGLYPALSALENLRFSAQVFRSEIDDHTLSFARECGPRPVSSLPWGTRRLLAYLVAEQHDPDLFVLDEPTSGMDPVARMRLWKEIHRKADSGAGALVTTHYMAEAAQCDRCVILSQGVMLANGTVDEIIGRHRSLVVRASRWQEAFACLHKAGLPVSFEGRALRVVDGREDQIRALLDSVGERYEIEHVPASLEEMLAILPRQNASHA